MKFHTAALIAITWVAGCGGDNKEMHSSDPACSNGIDDDGDGLVDFPADPGCASAQDESEDSAAMPQCSDGRDNDGDGKTDYPNDPGCPAPQQDSEVDDCPDGPECAQCANGKDDDQNGYTDYPDDPGCTSAADGDEYTEHPAACGTGIMIHQLPVTGSATGLFDASTKFMQVSPCGGGDANGVAAAVYELRITAPTVIIANTDGSDVGTVLDLRSASCDDASSEVACNADTMPTLTASLQPGTYYLLVESRTNTLGNYTLNVQEYAGEGTACTDPSECAPGFVCRIPYGGQMMSCEKPVCSDGRDDDSDGKMDYPNDPGCASPTDADETDDCPSGPNCPQCANGIDDDSDGQTDYPADTACTSAGGSNEASCANDMDNLGTIAGPTTTGDLATAHHDFTLSCQSSTGNDASFILVLPVPVTSLTVDTDGSVASDTALDLWSGACASSLACDDDSGSGLLSSISTGALSAGTYAITVAGYSSSNNEVVHVNVHGTLAEGTSCEGTLADSGALTCETGTFCRGTLGARTCQPASCNDGLDNDGDMKIDYPEDPGCTSSLDDDESDDCPNGANCPACSNGMDDDSDGHTDYPADPSCTSAGSTSEASCPSEHDPITVISAPTTMGTLAGLTGDHTLTCQSNTGNDAVFTLPLDVPVASLTIDTEGSTGATDTVLAFYDDPCLTSLACDDDSGSGALSTLTRTNVAAGAYSIIVAGYSSSNNLPFTLNVHGTLAAGASCESALVTAGVLACGPGLACSGAMGSRTCGAAACANGIDDDGDGHVDYPDDPGCAGASDNDETDPATPPVCSNATDDDGDGTTDYPADVGCAAAGSSTEVFCSAEKDPPVLVTTPSTMADLSTATHDVTLSCTSNTGNDRTVALRLPVAVASLTVDTEGSTASDTVLQVSDSLCTTSLACDDDSGSGSLSSITLANVAAGLYAITATGYGSSNNQPVKINVHGTLASGTRCDSSLVTAGVLACATGLTCSGTPAVCH